jgi:hypothetical protein
MVFRRRVRTNRVSIQTFATIQGTIPARLAHLEQQAFDVYPLTVVPETRIVGFERNAGNDGFVLSWSSLSENRYRIDRSTDLFTWEKIADVIPDLLGESTYEIMDPVPAPDSAVFRVSY